jgi:hypothetical protein
MLEMLQKILLILRNSIALFTLFYHTWRGPEDRHLVDWLFETKVFAFYRDALYFVRILNWVLYISFLFCCLYGK